ncbi:MAG: HesB/IscA family protein, partial [Alphaproteobacteria bacterium]
MSAEAARRINELTADGEYKGMMLRVTVSGGGCSGFRYGFAFDDSQKDDDRLVERDAARMLIDEVSWDFIA